MTSFASKTDFLRMSLAKPPFLVLQSRSKTTSNHSMVCLEASWNGFGKSWCFFAIKNYNEDVLEWSWGCREASRKRFEASGERLRGGSDACWRRLGRRLLRNLVLKDVLSEIAILGSPKTLQNHLKPFHGVSWERPGQLWASHSVFLRLKTPIKTSWNGLGSVLKRLGAS